MSVSLRTRVMVWGRAAGRCSFPGCTRDLVHDATETDDESLVGDVAHIVAESCDGPRGSSDITDEQRAKYDNLLLLCKVHHKLVDDQPTTYPVEHLEAMKREHEARVGAALSPVDLTAQADREIYAGYVDEWGQRAHVPTWTVWTSWLLAPDPRIELSLAEELQALRTWILGRVWPGRSVGLENALNNFGRVLNDLLLTVHEHAETCGIYLHPRRFYQIQGWDPELYDRLLGKYERHVALIHDLVLELTRAANLICDLVRERVDPAFRMAEGVLLVESGPFEDLTHRTYRAEYRGEERSDHPYPGLSEFKGIRRTRDFTFASDEEVP